MKWLLIILGVIIGLIVVVFVVGSILPEGHTATRTAKYSQPADKVWRTITALEDAVEWRSGLKSVERLPDRNGNPVWQEISDFGPMTYEVTVFEPPHKMVMVIADEELPFGGTWTYEIAEADGGSTLTITEEGKIYNPFFRFMAKFIFGYRATMETYLKDLGKHFGEDVSFQET